MFKPGFLRIFAVLIFIGCATSYWSQAIPRRAFTPNPLQVFLTAKPSRTTVLSALYWQVYGGAWEDQYKYTATYNEQGLCSNYSTYFWNYDISGWDKTMIFELSYRPDNRFLHAERKDKLNGIWIPYLKADWTYTGENLDQMAVREYLNGGEVSHRTTTFDYDLVSGRLQSVTETFPCLDSANPPMNKFVYEWDLQGRPIVVQKYQKRYNEPDWNLDIRDTYTYLPEDQSTYAQHLRYLECYYAFIDYLFTSGENPSLIDQNPMLYSSDGGLQWNDYYLLDYSYNQELKLITKQRILSFSGINALEIEIRYTYQDNLISNETWYEPFGSEGEIAPVNRLVFEYSDVSANDDPASPPLNSTITLYPNPFNESTTVQFELAKTAVTSLSVYNLKGQKLRVLHNSSLNSGQHKIVWDGKDSQGKPVNSGIYLIRMDSDNSCSVHKVMLLK